MRKSHTMHRRRSFHQRGAFAQLVASLLKCRRRRRTRIPRGPYCGARERVFCPAAPGSFREMADRSWAQCAAFSFQRTPRYGAALILSAPFAPPLLGSLLCFAHSPRKLFETGAFRESFGHSDVFRMLCQ